jgi:hypothetical protein
MFGAVDRIKVAKEQNLLGRVGPLPQPDQRARIGRCRREKKQLCLIWIKLPKIYQHGFRQLPQAGRVAGTGIHIRPSDYPLN